MQAVLGAVQPPKALLRRYAHAQRSLKCKANYRWSAAEAGGRKRESLYGYDDNGEPQPASSVGADGGGTPPDADWQQPWPEAEQQPEAAWGTQQQQQQQQGWDAAAADGSAPRQRRARGAAAAGSGRLTGRLRERRQQRQQQQEQQGAAPPPEDDPWVAAELRQLRRRQGAKQEPAGSAAAPLPDPWAQEWGPLEAAPAAAAAAAEDYGWAAESWAPGAGSTARGPAGRREQKRQEAQEEEAAGAGAGSRWDLRQQQREQRRRRRRSVGQEGDEGEQQGSAYGTGRPVGAAAAAAQPYAGRGYGGEAFEEDLEEDEYLGDNYGDDVAAGSASWRGPSASGGTAGEGYSEAYEPGVSAEPDIALLSTEELEQVLPVVPFSQQAAFFSGSATDGVQRWGASLALTVLLSKVAVLAATSLTWPLWWPWALAARKNLAVRRQFKYGGLWRTQVLGVQVTGRPKPFSSTDTGAGGGGLLGGSTMRMAKVLVGDPGGAQTEMVLPYDSRYELIQPGEPAELMVLSSDTSFQQFKAVKDVYLPSSGLWVSEYPHCDRTQLLEVSLQVEREAVAAAEADAAGQQQQQAYSNGSGSDYEPQFSGGAAAYGQGGSGSGGNWSEEDEWEAQQRY